MESQKKLIEKRNWDYLIVLDACRYDYFKENYKSYMEGDLKKAISAGYNTGSWLVNTYSDYYEGIVYVSANPYINSHGLSLNEQNSDWSYSWKASEHFAKIIDVWNWGWKESLNTVPPETVNEAALKARDNYPKSKFIIHYIQPYAPYLINGIPKEKQEMEEENIRVFFSSIVENPKQVARWFQRELKRSFPLHPKEMFVRKGKSALTYAYKKNLQRVLESAKDFSRKNSGKIVITSDHGEFLGEEHKFEHSPHKGKYPQLREVPWFTVEGWKGSL
ncbi:hypothetical protein AKJ52_00665 [candidate division MSBL1 archaeon SCGC-AAA382C18]|uniref:Sulfatase N-terminal domain-containing protein n=1 Tax=candidate division MSBL1 archaeon SCGC-AAA382C18 TaxID=1698281 RepID=A0A133VLC0_9EURY|nr:hypothetical protein AKJ52_00665 [candidate division MSBL1 archaeon SCGC-AAA382C18]